jgi:hypothetical protein
VITVGSARPFAVQLESYLRSTFHTREAAVAPAIQALFVWFFSLLRNIVVCGFLQYLADVSGSIPLKIFSITAYVAIAVYCISYVPMRVFTPFHFVKHKRISVVLDGFVTLAIMLPVMFLILGGMWFSINEIAKGHAASRQPYSSPLRPGAALAHTEGMTASTHWQYRSSKGAIMDIRPIRTEDDHRAALAALWGAPEGTEDGDQLDVLLALAPAGTDGRDDPSDQRGMENSGRPSRSSLQDRAGRLIHDRACKAQSTGRAVAHGWLKELW